MSSGSISALANVALDPVVPAAFRSTDPATTIAAMSRLLAPHEMHIAKHGEIDTRVRYVRLPTCTIADIRYGARVSIRSQVPSSRYLIHALIEGSSAVYADGHAIDLAPEMIHVSPPGEAIVIEFGETSRHLTVSIESALVRAGLAGAAMGDRPAGDPAHIALRWRELLNFVLSWRDSAPPGAGGQDKWLDGLVAGFVCDRLSDQLPAGPFVGSVPHSAPRRAAELIPGYMLRARRLIEDAVARGESELTLATLATRAGTSVRTLQAGFRRDFRCTFREQLRVVRLDALHRELGQADAATSVTRSMLACGITSFGRYAGYYRTRFGMLPSARPR
jgi:AraC-like DNA-binding protein